MHRHQRNRRRGGKQFSEAGRDLASVFGDDVGVLHGRARIGMAGPVLPRSHRNSLAIHRGLISVPESVEAAALDLQFLQQRVIVLLLASLPLPERTLIQSDRGTRCLAENLGDFLAAELENPT